MRTPAANALAQQRVFDPFRREYNDERPHEALRLKPPLTAYAPSKRRYPRPLLQMADHDAELCLADERWAVSWGPILLGWLDEGRLDRGLIMPTKKRR